VRSIEQLDKNFAPTEVSDGQHWHDIRNLEIEGRGWDDTAGFFDRLPARAKGNVRDVLWDLSQHSAGICARFVTDATTLSARWTLRFPALAMDHMPATGVSGLDLYTKHKGEWIWAGTGRPKEFPTNSVTLADQLTKGRREFLLYLPLYNGIESVSIGLPPDAKLFPVPRRTGNARKGVVFYGTSIVQGGCASRAGMGYPEIIGRTLNCQTINLGFSGNGWMDMEIAHLLSELNPAMYVIDCVPNMTAAHVNERAEVFLRTLRHARPKLPILLVEAARPQRAMWQVPNVSAYTAANAALAECYRRMTTLGDRNLFYLRGEKLLGNDNLGTVDGVHPTDLGFTRIAAAVGRAVGKLL
jgi:hypothetical protein